VKTSAAPASTGEVLETTTRTRRISDTDGTTPEFWTYLENLPEAQRDSHVFYIYRDDPGPAANVAKFDWRTAEANGIPFNDREECEVGFAQKFGGRTFRIIVKSGPQRVTMGRIYVNSPPKLLQPQNSESTSPTVTPMGESAAAADVAKTAISTMANQDRLGIDTAIIALRTANEVISSRAKSSDSATDDAMKTAMVAMMQRAMNPPDTLETIVKLLPIVLEVMKVINPTASQNPMFTKIMETALEKLMNPTPSGPATSAGAELVRQLPNVVSYATEAIREWRVGSEAQLHTAELMARGGIAPRPGQAPTGPPQVLPPPNVNPSTPPQQTAAPKTPMTLPSLEFIEQKIVEIVRRPTPAEEAADATLEFLTVMDPSVVVQLANLGEEKLMALFATRPVLAQLMSNPQRVRDFVSAFLKFTAEDEENAKREAAGKPPIPQEESKQA